MRCFVAQFDRGIAVRQDAARRCRAARDVWSDVDTAVWEPLVAIYCGRPDEATPLLEEYKAVAERVGHQTVLWFYNLSEAMAALTRGQLDVAESAARHSLAFGQSRAIGWRFADALYLGLINFCQGRSADAVAHLRDAIRAEPPGTHFTGISAASLMCVLAHVGDPAASNVLRDHRPTCRSEGTYRRKAHGARWRKSSRASRCWAGATRPRPFTNRPRISSPPASSGMPTRCLPQPLASHLPAHASGHARKRITNLQSGKPMRRIAFASPRRACGTRTCCSHAPPPATETGPACCLLKHCRSTNQSACQTSHSARARAWRRPPANL